MRSFNRHESWIAPWSSRETTRLILVAEISDPKIIGEAAKPIAEVLSFGRLASHVKASSEFLPFCLAAESVESSAVQWKRARAMVATNRANASVWVLPGADVYFYVQLVDVNSTTGNAGLVAALEDMYYGDLVIAGDSSMTAMQHHTRGRMHQLVVSSEGGSTARDPSDDHIQRLIYRADLPGRSQYTRISRPDELNRRPGRGAALSPFVSFLWGQQDHIENCAFLSVLIGTAAASVIAHSRKSVLGEIIGMGEYFGQNVSLNVKAADDVSARQRIQESNRVIAKTQNRLALCIDGLSTLLPYIPSLRVESYHAALFNTLDTEENRAALERLVARLSDLVRIEQNSLDTRVALDAHARVRRWSISIGFASTIAIPIGIVFGFFGVGTTDFDPLTSMFAAQNWLIFTLVLGATGAVALIHYYHYRKYMHQAPPRPE